MRRILLIILVFHPYLICSQHIVFTNYADVKAQMKDARVIMLGEVDHGDQSSMIEKVELLKFLHDSLNFNLLAFESSIYDMAKADSLLTNNTQVALHTGTFPIWHNTQSFDSLISALNNRKFILAGFDNQICSGAEGVCLKMPGELSKYLLENDIPHEKSLIERIEKEIKSFNSTTSTISPTFDPALLEQLIQLGNDVKQSKHPKKEYWYQIIASMHGLFYDHHFNKIAEKSSKTFQPTDSNLRDSLMASNLLYLLNEYPDTKIICWGATYHFANNVQNLILSDNDFANAKPIGYYLKKQLGDKIKIVGFTDLGKAASHQELLEHVMLYKHEKAIYTFSAQSIGKSSFLKYAPYPVGDWSNVLDFGIVINTNGAVKCSGRVVYAAKESNELLPVPFAHIQIEGTTQGSVSNENGTFELIIQPEFLNHKVIFSSLGFADLRIDPSEINGNIQLFDQAELLNEVIVTSDQYDPAYIVRLLAQNRVKSVPQTPFMMTMYNYQEEINSLTNELKVRESAIEEYYENRLQKNELRISNILNYRSITKKVPDNPWSYAIYHADFQSDNGFAADQTFKALQIDTIYTHPTDNSYGVIEYTHLQPSLKTSGFGLASDWKGKLVYNPETMTIKSHQKDLHFRKNEDYGLFHISLIVEYFEYKQYTLPRLMTAEYQFKNADGAISKGTEKILITNVELDKPQKPKTAVWEFKNAPFDQSFWKNFNTIPLIKN